MRLPLFCHICQHSIISYESDILCSSCYQRFVDLIKPGRIREQEIEDARISMFSLFEYHDSEYIAHIVSLIKFSNQPIFLKLLLDIPQEWDFLPAVDEVWYIPTSFRKFLERGFSPPRLIAEYLGKKLGIPVVKGLKKKDTLSQSSKTRDQRWSIYVQSPFTLSSKGQKAFGETTKSILLVDDIATTGATLIWNAQHILASAHPSPMKVVCFSVFHSERFFQTKKEDV